MQCIKLSNMRCVRSCDFLEANRRKSNNTAVVMDRVHDDDDDDGVDDGVHQNRTKFTDNPDQCSQCLQQVGNDSTSTLNRLNQLCRVNVNRAKASANLPWVLCNSRVLGQAALANRCREEDIAAVHHVDKQQHSPDASATCVMLHIVYQGHC